jgi:hypothetical protein
MSKYAWRNKGNPSFVLLSMSTFKNVQILIQNLAFRIISESFSYDQCYGFRIFFPDLDFSTPGSRICNTELKKKLLF